MDRIAKLREFLAANPADSFIQHALALEHIKAGDKAEARRLFQSLLSRDENYVGSYYHLAKLLEEMNERDEAISIYEKGMIKAKEAGDMKAFNELQGAYEELTE